VPTNETVRKNGGLVTRTARSVRRRRQLFRQRPITHEQPERRARPFVLLRGSILLQQRVRCAGAHGDSSPWGPGRAPARSAGAARNRPFSGSCSRSYRCGRNRKNGVIVVEARSTRETGLRAEAKRGRGKSRPRDRRPSDGRRSGSSNTRRPFTGRHEEVVSAARSQAPPLHRSGGPPHRASEEGRRSAVTGASEGERSVDSTGRTRPRRTTEPRHPKRVGRRENAPRIRASPQGSRSGRRTKRGCPSSLCRWQKLVARISGR